MPWLLWPHRLGYSIYNGYQENIKEIGIGAKQAVLPFTIPKSCCRYGQLGNYIPALLRREIVFKLDTLIDTH
jgi:hypothetical protein